MRATRSWPITSSRLTAALLAHAERAGAKVIAVGDPGQLQSVEAGGWLAALADRQPELALREVIRQYDPAEREALEALHDGDPERYLIHKQSEIIVHADEHEAAGALLDQWLVARDAHGPPSAAMVARDNQTRTLLNGLARERLKAQQLLAAYGPVIGGREYVVGDRVIARRNDRQLEVDNGTLATVLAIEGDRMHVLTDAGKTRALELSYVAEHVEHAYALTAHGAQGATVTWAGVLGRPEKFTREWAYTALSRAREKTVLHVIAEQSTGIRETDAYNPATTARSPARALVALRRAMAQSEAEPLAAQSLATARSPDRRRVAAQLARQQQLDRLALDELKRELATATRIRLARQNWRHAARPGERLRL